jgi:hypothetical protein
MCTARCVVFPNADISTLFGQAAGQCHNRAASRPTRGNYYAINLGK